MYIFPAHILPCDLHRLAQARELFGVADLSRRLDFFGHGRRVNVVEAMSRKSVFPTFSKTGILRFRISFFRQ